MPRPRKVIEVIDLVDSEPENIIVDLVEDTSIHCQLKPGSLVETPYGVGQVIERKTESSRSPSLRKRRRYSTSSFCDITATIDHDSVKVQLSFGVAYLSPTCVKSLSPDRITDSFRCLPRIMLNDNVINFALANLRCDEMAKISQHKILVADTYCFELIRKYILQKNINDMERKRKFLKVLKIDNVTELLDIESIVFPISAHVSHNYY